MSDKYFEDKAKFIYNTYIEPFISLDLKKNKYIINKMKHEIYLDLKEIARDQRHACCEAVDNVKMKDEYEIPFSIIQRCANACENSDTKKK